MIKIIFLPVPTERITEDLKSLNMISSPMVRFSYGNWHVDMWDVTWYYIARSNKKKK